METTLRQYILISESGVETHYKNCTVFIHKIIIILLYFILYHPDTFCNGAFQELANIDNIPQEHKITAFIYKSCYEKQELLHFLQAFQIKQLCLNLSNILNRDIDPVCEESLQKMSVFIIRPNWPIMSLFCKKSLTS